MKAASVYKIQCAAQLRDCRSLFSFSCFLHRKSNTFLLYKQTKITAKIDTGSTLKEPFSNLPVIVAKESSVKSLLPQDIYNQAINFLKDKSPAINILNLKMRVVPFKTISEEGLLPAFKPDFIKINESNIKKEAYIALCPNNFMPTSVSALINPDVLD